MSAFSRIARVGMARLGIHPDTRVKLDRPKNAHLTTKGSAEDTSPWHWAATTLEFAMEGCSGFVNDRVDLRARIADKESETRA